MSNRLDDFLARLAANAPKEKEDFTKTQNNRSLEKVYLNFPGNFGRYQVFPMTSVVTDDPFIYLEKTREICIPRKYLDDKGQEVPYSQWVKILPKSAYMMKDMTGRVVSSLTALDEQILNQVYMLWDQLWNELDARNSLEIQKNLIRKRNYTIFHAMCLNKWEPNESRNPSRQNFSALFVCTAKGFVNCVMDNIDEKSLMNGGDKSWVFDIYNRQLSGRTGFLMFSINTKKDGSAGFAVTTTHEVGNNSFSSISINEEDAALMSDPIQSFLGNQAYRDDQSPVGSKRLFNQSLMQEAIQYISEQLAAVRAAKAMGEVDLKDVIKKTSDAALAKVVVKPRQQTNDPVLAAASGNNETMGGSGVVNPEAIRTENTNPFSSAPVYHSDPVTGAPVDGNNSGPAWGNSGFGQGSAPFTAPSFASGFGGNEKSDLPF